MTNFKPIKDYPGAIQAQLGNKPSFIFAGEAFESNPALKQTKSLLLDFFRGRQIESVNLKGLDRVVFITHAPLHSTNSSSIVGNGSNGSGAAQQLQQQQRLIVYFRQYAVKLKKSGTRVPRVELIEMGPHMDLEVRRVKVPPGEVEKEALQRPKVTAKKQKNVSTDMLEGKVGRIYMPKQNVDSMALNKMKGLKRERREAKATAKEERRDGGGGGGEGGGGRDKENEKGCIECICGCLCVV